MTALPEMVRPEESPRRNDPGRRDRIIESCLDVIAEVGVDGLTHRRVAAKAGVSLGSMTYYFTGINELLHNAFTRFATSSSERFEARMQSATTPGEACVQVVELITDDVFSSQKELVLAQELYTLAARAPEYRDITHAWMARSRAALGRHFDPLTVRMLDGLIEGLTLHRALGAETQDRSMVVQAVQRITALAPPS